MKRLFILSAIASLLVAMLSPSWAGTINTTKSNTFREACKGKPVGTVVKVEGKNEKCPAPPESKPETQALPLPPRPATHTPGSNPAERSP